MLSSESLATLGLEPAAALALPDGLRRLVVRFLLRWGGGVEALSLLADPDVAVPPPENGLPRDCFDRCRALLAAGELQVAQAVARDLVNLPDAGPWGHRAVGEVFLALKKPDRADERFRAGGDPVGRARAQLMLGKAEAARSMLREAPPDDPEADAVRLQALDLLGEETREAREHLRGLLEVERRDLQEALGFAGPPLPELAALLADGEPDEAALRMALERLFGYEEFRPGQLQMIAPLLAGRSVLGLMPTGAGKSLCFQLPAALLPGATVVISPLIALMKDQVDGLPPPLYRRATLINSSLEPGEAERRLDQVSRGEVSLIYAAPERLRQRPFVRALQRRGVSLFVVDEAHCVSLWGHDFRPDYFFIRRVLEDLGRPAVLALTATATPAMHEDIQRQLAVEFEPPVNLGTFRPNLRFSVRKLPVDGAKWIELLSLLRGEKGPAIVYVDRRKLAEDLAARLRQEGIEAEAYHAGMDREARDGAQTRFMLGRARVIAATVAFGMGVDKADVRLVVHYNLPRCLEAYYQEAGRAGRDGRPARCVLLYTSYDEANLSRRSQQDRLPAPEVLAVHRALVGRARAGTGPVAVEEVAKESGSTETRVRVAIGLLQRIGVAERGYDLPAALWLAAPRAAADERAIRFSEAIGLKPGAPVTVRGDRAAAAAGIAADALETALLDWQEAGWLRYRANGRGMGIRTAAGARDLRVQVQSALDEMARMDDRRLHLLSLYLRSSACRQGFVSEYFGKPLEGPCGVCDNCLPAASGPEAARVREKPTPPYAEPGGPPISDDESALFERLRAWRREKARQEGIPAYVLFADRALYAIARARPRSPEALAAVPGVSRGSLLSYGEEVLALVSG